MTILKKMTAVMAAGVLALSMTATAGAANTTTGAATNASCTHNLIRDSGTKIKEYGWYHTFTLTNGNGKEFTERCGITETTYLYKWNCTRCGAQAVKTKEETRYYHSNPQCDERK